jgi:hypothetical protein
MKIALSFMLLAALVALPLAGETISNKKFVSVAGMQLPDGQDAAIEAGETLVARVVNVAIAARIGFKDLKKGDEVQVTLMSAQRDKKLKLMHVPSNQVVTLNFEEIKVTY